MAIMEPWMSWTAVIVIGSVACWYYMNKDNGRRQRGRPLQRAADAVKAKDEDWGVSDAVAKTAAKAPKPPKAKAARKSVKKAVQEVGNKVDAVLSAASSAAGADADDDMSPANSPALGATHVKAHGGKDVSDMLEPQGATPSVLRLTGSSQPTKKAKQQQAAAPQESKKQRQNRKKAEEAKAQREADEQQRKVLLENQRRTAREARGESAKNGLKPATVPAGNAWNGPKETKKAIAPAHEGQLLDTFDLEGSTASSENAGNGTSASTESMNNSAQWANNLPSEEEQYRMMTQDAEWTTVPKGKKVRKTKANGAADTASEHGSEPTAPQSPPPVKKAPVKKAPAVQPMENNKTAPTFGFLPEIVPVSQVSHPLDSDWPVV